MPPRPNAAAVERPRLRTTQRTECIFITQLPIMTEWRVYLRDVGRAASAIPFINSFGARQRGESCSGQAVPYMRARRFCIARASSTATYAHLNSSAAQRNHHARSRATSMSMPRDLARSFVGTEGFKQSQQMSGIAEVSLVRCVMGRPSCRASSTRRPVDRSSKERP